MVAPCVGGVGGAMVVVRVARMQSDHGGCTLHNAVVGWWRWVCWVTYITTVVTVTTIHKVISATGGHASWVCRCYARTYYIRVLGA